MGLHVREGQAGAAGSHWPCEQLLGNVAASLVLQNNRQEPIQASKDGSLLQVQENGITYSAFQ